MARIPHIFAHGEQARLPVGPESRRAPRLTPSLLASLRQRCSWATGPTKEVAEPVLDRLVKECKAATVARLPAQAFGLEPEENAGVNRVKVTLSPIKIHIGHMNRCLGSIPTMKS